MKSLQSKADDIKGLRELFLESMKEPTKILEETFSMLDMKRKSVKIFKSCSEEAEIILLLLYL